MFKSSVWATVETNFLFNTDTKHIKGRQNLEIKSIPIFP